jgi:hypothetical protein
MVINGIAIGFVKAGDSFVLSKEWTLKALDPFGQISAVFRAVLCSDQLILVLVEHGNLHLAAPAP